MIDREKVVCAIENCIGQPKCKDCPWEDCEVEHEVVNRVPYGLLRDALALLKDQEPKIGHWIFESRYCEAWSHTCSECGKRMTTAVGMYASFCWNCGAKMTGGDSSSSETPNS